MANYTAQTPSNPVSGYNYMSRRYAMTQDQVNTFVTYLNSDFTSAIAKIFTNPMDNIISLYAYPFDASFSMTGTEENIRVGNYTLTNGTGASATHPKGVLLANGNNPLLNLGKFTIPSTASFLDYAPYTKIEIYLPYIGFVTLDNDQIIGKETSLYYAVDLSNGSCTAFIVVGGVVIAERSGQMGKQVIVAGGTGASMMKAVAGIGATVLGGAAAIGGASTTLGASALIAGTGVNAINSGKTTIEKSGMTTSNNGIYGPQAPYVLVTKTKVNRPTNYNHTYGRPSGKKATLGDLSGFTKVDAVHLENTPALPVFGMASRQEKEEIERLLKEGVILPTRSST